MEKTKSTMPKRGICGAKTPKSGVKAKEQTKEKRIASDSKIAHEAPRK